MREFAAAIGLSCVAFLNASLAQPKLERENIPPGEGAAIAKLIGIQTKVSESFQGARGQHPKPHGILRAKFVVDADLEEGLRHGLFAKTGEYECLIRFSNGNSADDTSPDVHGMAIKVVGIEGENSVQDFVLIDHDVFFARDAESMAELFAATIASKMTKSKEPVAKWAATHPEEAPHFFAAVANNPFPESPLTVNYGSTTPFKFGDGAAKWFVKPQDGEKTIDAAGKSGSYLRDAMIARLKPAPEAKPVVFDFFVQRQVADDPIEDPTTPWKGELQHAATIVIEPQDFDQPAPNWLGERAAFDPWNALPAHQPLGGINRARGKVYPKSVTIREGLRSKGVDLTPEQVKSLNR